MAGRIQDADVKTLAEVISNGGVKNQLMNDSKIFISATPIIGSSKTLDEYISAEFDGPLRMYGSNPPNTLLNFTSNETKRADGTGRSAPPISSTIPIAAASTINFQTGATIGATFDNLTFPASTIGQFRRVGFTLLANGHINAIWSDQAASLGAIVINTGNLFLTGGVPIGWVDLVATGATAFKTAGSATSIIENQVSSVSTIHGFGSGGSAGGATSASSTGYPADGFQLLSFDNLDVPETDALSKVEPIKTNAIYDLVNSMYALSCDKSRTVSSNTGTAIDINSSPGFTVQPGDIMYMLAGPRIGQWRRIVTVTNQYTYVLDSAFTGGNAAFNNSVMVSQAVWTKDLVNIGDAVQLTRPHDIFPATDILATHIEYEDSLTAGDAIADLVSAARIVVSGSNEGLSTDIVTYPTSDKFTQIFARPQAPNSWPDYALATNTNQQRLFFAFFPNPNNGSVTTLANLLNFSSSFYTDTLLATGGVLDSSFCYADPADITPTVNCSRAVVGGKTRVKSGFTIVNINPSKTAGAVSVFVNGSSVPKQVAGSTTGPYWTHVIGSSDTIEFWMDLTGSNPSIDIILREGMVDLSTVNAARFSVMFDAVAGSAAQVASGIATHTSPNAAIAASVAGATLMILKGTYTENIVVDKRMQIFGQGRDSLILGTFTIQPLCDYGLFRNFKVDKGSAGVSITFASGAVGNFMTECWQATGQTVNEVVPGDNPPYQVWEE